MSGTRKLRILIADDHAVVREGLAAIIAVQPDMELAGQAGDGVEAVELAQAYLDTYVSDNLEVDQHADPFYGYYTLHVNRAGQTIGMLSVNGYTGEVFLHTWHGNLLEMSGE